MATGPVGWGWHDLRGNWGWLLVLGILLVILGMVALSVPFLTTVVVVLFYGWMLLISSVFHLIAVFFVRRWAGVFLQLLAAFLSFFVGLFMVVRPGVSILLLTEVIALLLIVGGLFRAITSLFLQYPNWGWAVLSGLVALLLGIMVWRGWPPDAAWFIGMCVAINFIFEGWTLITIALALRPTGVSQAPPGPII
jgi:uncharacterized membrane protein HdeD (DUF308 family)